MWQNTITMLLAISFFEGSCFGQVFNWLQFQFSSTRFKKNPEVSTIINCVAWRNWCSTYYYCTFRFCHMSLNNIDLLCQGILSVPGIAGYEWVPARIGRFYKDKIFFFPNTNGQFKTGKMGAHLSADTSPVQCYLAALLCSVWKCLVI